MKYEFVFKISNFSKKLKPQNLYQLTLPEQNTLFRVQFSVDIRLSIIRMSNTEQGAYMLEFSHKLANSNDKLKLIVDIKHARNSNGEHLLFMYTEKGVVSGQFPISQTKAVINESDNKTSIKFQSVKIKNDTYILDHYWLLDGLVGDTLLRFFTNIGMAATTTDEIDVLCKAPTEKNKSLISGDKYNISAFKNTLFAGNQFTFSKSDMNHLGVNVLHQGHSIKVEMWYREHGLYAGWFFDSKEFESIVGFYRSIGYEIANPDPMHCVDKSSTSNS